VYKHIFLSIVLFNLSYDLEHISRNNFLLIKHLGLQLCHWDSVTIVDDIPVTPDGRELCLLVRLVLTSRKMVLFVPRPWYRRCCRHSWRAIFWHTLLMWPMKSHRSSYFWSTLPHSSTGSEPDSPVYPWFRSILCSWPCVLSRATLREMIYSRCSEPLLTPCSGIDRMSIRLIHLIVPLHFALDVLLKLQLERYFCRIP
jgi:hypothetical protein